ncbi:MAG TPA: MarR family transcriptional regulator [Gemmatimonadaceae bacterium]|nr:MarR family transcriptional regulator [Gemmatimonadaceae bacterium]
MAKRKEKDVSRALNAVRRMVRGLRSAAEAVERDFRISAAQLFVLTELGTMPDQSVKDLAAVTMTTHSTVSQVVGQLLSKGLVARTTDSADARRSVLRLTSEGQTLLKKAPRAVQEDLIDGFASLSPTVQRAVATGLEKWLEASGMGRVQSGMLFEKPLLESRKTRRGSVRSRKPPGGRRSPK